MFGKLRAHHFADALLVDGGRMMLGLELDQDFAVLRADVVAWEKRHRIGLRQVDVVAYLLQLIGGNYLPDRALDIVDNHCGSLDPGSARRAHVKFHESGVDRRKEILARDVQQREGPDDHQRGAGQREAAMCDEGSHRRHVMLADALEAGFEPAQEPSARGSVPWTSWCFSGSR